MSSRFLFFFVDTMNYCYIGTEIIIHCISKETFSSSNYFLQPVGWLSFIRHRKTLLLVVEVEDLRVDAGRAVARLRTRILDPDAAATNATASGTVKSDKPEKTVEFILHADGQATDIEGLDRLSADEQTIWKEWVSRFGGGAAYPERGIKPGEKWKVDEPISNALLSGLQPI